MRRPKAVTRILAALELQPMTRMELDRVLSLQPRGAEQSIQQLARLGAIKVVERRPGNGGAKVWGLTE